VYPRANWLFAFAFIGIGVILLNYLFARDPSPGEVADLAEKLLKGTFGGWDVDDYEHLNLRELQLRDLWLKTMHVGGLPEGWVNLDETRKSELRSIICALRAFGASSSSPPNLTDGQSGRSPSP
jgi:hypothetical protein